MTRNEARTLHNPFLRDGAFPKDLQIVCSDRRPSAALISGKETVILTFADQTWVDFVGDNPTIRAVFLDRPKARDLRPIGKLPIYNLTLSYPSYVHDWEFLSSLDHTLLRLTLHNTLSLGRLNLMSGLSNLEAFTLSGGYSKEARYPSLEAIGRLSRLRAIDLAAVRFENPDLSSLRKLQDLARFDCPLHFPRGEVEKLKSHFPNLESNALNPVQIRSALS